MFHRSLIDRTGSTTSLAEIVHAFSYALDLVESRPSGHCVRSCIIGSRIGEAIGLSVNDRNDLYYALLLKDLGCGSNAARIQELYQVGDPELRGEGGPFPGSLKMRLGLALSRKVRATSFAGRAMAFSGILGTGDQIAQEMVVAHRTRGSELARTLRFSQGVCDAIYHLDEHWDGSGRPGRLNGQSIPLFSRIALLAQTAEMFHNLSGPEAALDEVRARAGNWLDPELARVFERLVSEARLWRALKPGMADRYVLLQAPSGDSLPIDEEYLDDITRVFGQVIDGKSPYTVGHSGRVADYSDALAARMDMAPARRRWLRRAAALHDVGKLGVPDAIFGKSDGQDAAEWQAMRAHALHTGELLAGLPMMADSGTAGIIHHDRASRRPLSGAEEGLISLETRIITACDYYDALTAARPYRAAMTREQALDIMNGDVGAAIDRECFEALKQFG